MEANKQYAVVSTIGKDRIGIVDDLSDSILEMECNVEESRMAVLGGEFAIILLISGKPDYLDNLVAKLPKTLEEIGLRAEVKLTTAPRPDTESRPYMLECVSLDTPGIVHSVSSLLRKHNINVEAMETDTASAPWTGAPLFILRARVSIPSTESLSRIRDEIDDLASEQDLDITIKPVSGVTGELKT